MGKSSLNRDLTVGRPEKVLWNFCLPLFASILFQQLYNIADSLVAGKWIGEHALAAVGNSYEITLIFIAFAIGANMGCSVVTARLFGGRQYGRMKTAVYTGFLSIAALCAVLMALGLFFGGGLLRLIHTPEDIFADSKLYLDIYILGLPFLFFYNVSTGIFSALGDSRTPFFFLAASSTSNILVDILFVDRFRMGVAGVGWATFLCQGVSCLLALCVIFSRLRALPAGKVPVFSWEAFCRLSAAAVPGILQQSSISLGNIVLQGVINGFGPGVIAGYSAAVKLNNLVISSLTTLGNGISSYTAQNIGAGQMDRVRAGFRAGLRIVWLLCVPIALLYWLGAAGLIHIFLDEPSDTALLSGVSFLRIVSPFYFVISAKLVLDGILRGSGMMMRFMAATCTDLIVRVALSFAFAAPFGITGVWCSWPFGWAAGLLLVAASYRAGPWSGKEKRDESGGVR